MEQPRIALARFLIRLGKGIQSLALLVMTPGDLIAFGRETYGRPAGVSDWSGADWVDEGLLPEEAALLERSPVQGGRLLLLGLGGGREAIALAKRGFSLTGVDFVPAMVVRAKAHAARHGVALEGLVQEISRLAVPPGSHDLVWLSTRIYSAVPGRARRVQMLRRIAPALRRGGCLVCQFHWEPEPRISPRAAQLCRLFARLIGGYRDFEPGDQLWGHVEFIHGFSDPAVLNAEFAAGGFELLHLALSAENRCGGAVLQRRNKDE